MGVRGEGRQSLGHDPHPYGCTHTARGLSLNYHAQQTPAGSTEQNQQASNEEKQCPQLTTQKEKPQNTKHCAQHMLLNVTLRKAEGEKARQKGISRKEAWKEGRKEGHVRMPPLSSDGTSRHGNDLHPQRTRHYWRNPRRVARTRDTCVLWESRSAM